MHIGPTHEHFLTEDMNRIKRPCQKKLPLTSQQGFQKSSWDVERFRSFVVAPVDDAPWEDQIESRYFWGGGLRDVLGQSIQPSGNRAVELPVLLVHHMVERRKRPTCGLVLQVRWDPSQANDEHLLRIATSNKGLTTY